MNETFNEYVFRSGKSLYKISKDTGIPYTTLNSLANKKADIKNCSAETVCRIAGYFGTTAEKMIKEPAPPLRKNCHKSALADEPFQWFRSWLQHKVKESETDTMLFLLQSSTIRDLFTPGSYVSCLYAISVLDYLCRKYDLPLCSDFEDIRACKLNEPYYVSAIAPKDKYEYLEEFAKHNIYEVTIHDVC